jgi:hypothetical protein
MTLISLHAVSEPGSPSQVNQDGWAAVENPIPPGWILAAVIDGASIRGTLPSLVAYLSGQEHVLEPAVWATSIVRCALYHTFTIHTPSSPSDAILAANRALRSAAEAVPSMAQVYRLLERETIEPLPDALNRCPGPLMAELQQVFTSLFPKDQWRVLDTRYLRLMLPACVTTVVRLNVPTGDFDFAHAGDTALMQVDTTGHVHLLSQDQMKEFDNNALQLALDAVQQEDNQINTVAEAVQAIPAVKTTNALNGLRHNYVDENGHTHPEKGCGVIDGLEVLSDYVQTGRGILSPGHRLYLMSDGMTLPLSQSRSPVPAPVRDSIEEWKRALQGGNLMDLLKSTRHITSIDTSYNVFPRLKQQDDATALVITIQ